MIVNKTVVHEYRTDDKCVKTRVRTGCPVRAGIYYNIAVYCGRARRRRTFGGSAGTAAANNTKNEMEKRGGDDDRRCVISYRNTIIIRREKIHSVLVRLRGTYV